MVDLPRRAAHVAQLIQDSIDYPLEARIAMLLFSEKMTEMDVVRLFKEPEFRLMPVPHLERIRMYVHDIEKMGSLIPHTRLHGHQLSESKMKMLLSLANDL